jgi:hypothetical protein
MFNQQIINVLVKSRMIGLEDYIKIHDALKKKFSM